MNGITLVSHHVIRGGERRRRARRCARPQHLMRRFHSSKRHAPAARTCSAFALLSRQTTLLPQRAHATRRAATRLLSLCARTSNQGEFPARRCAWRRRAAFASFKTFGATGGRKDLPRVRWRQAARDEESAARPFTAALRTRMVVLVVVPGVACVTWGR